jgi:hypothetical protein
MISAWNEAVWLLKHASQKRPKKNLLSDRSNPERYGPPLLGKYTAFFK